MSAGAKRARAVDIGTVGSSEETLGEEVAAGERAEQDIAYLDGVLQVRRDAFADAESDNVPRLYEACFRRGRENDWSQLRALLLLLRTTLRISNRWTNQIAFGLQLSHESAADAETVRELHR